MKLRITDIGLDEKMQELLVLGQDTNENLSAILYNADVNENIIPIIHSFISIIIW